MRIVRYIFAVILGFLIGSMVNMALIMVSGHIIPPPDGVETTSMESLKASMHLFQPKHFLFPFLAHALGTFVGALIAAFIAPAHKLRFALTIGILFLLGGIANCFMLPAPSWFMAVDLIGAYVPMAWLGATLAVRSNPE